MSTGIRVEDNKEMQMPGDRRDEGDDACGEDHVESQPIIIILSVSPSVTCTGEEPVCGCRLETDCC